MDTRYDARLPLSCRMHRRSEWPGGGGLAKVGPAVRELHLLYSRGSWAIATAKLSMVNVRTRAQRTSVSVPDSSIPLHLFKIVLRLLLVDARVATDTSFLARLGTPVSASGTSAEKPSSSNST